jgi:hypothetical protein
MHLVEHLNDLTWLLTEAARLLKPNRRIYFETPHPKTLVLSSAPGKMAGSFPMNFYDDWTHTKVVPVGALALRAKAAGLKVISSGISRNWLFATAYPVLVMFPPSRRTCTARLHWLGWSAYFIAERPIKT